MKQKIGRYFVNTRRNNALTPRQQVLTALHFLGNGCQYHVNGQTHGISKSTVLRCVHRLSRLISFHIMPLYIRWPTNSIFIEQEFFDLAGFPNVKGAVDGTIVHIDAPKIGEPLFVGRDNKHSINTLIVSGPKNQIFFVSAKSPGSFHDARALRVSNVWKSWHIERWRPGKSMCYGKTARMYSVQSIFYTLVWIIIIKFKKLFLTVGNDEDSIILGDSAYPLTSWLIPPTIRAASVNSRRLTLAVEHYQSAHRRTRFIVERTIGILKEEFPCLNHMRIKSTERIVAVIYSCATLHNMQNHFRRGSYAYDTVLNRIAQLPLADGDGVDNGWRRRWAK